MADLENRIFCRLDGLTTAEREQKRLTALKNLGLLEAETVAVFDEATQTAARVLDAPICILGLMRQDHLWLKSTVGLSIVGLMNQLAQSRQLPRSECFCTYVVDSHQVLAIQDTASSPVFASSLLVGYYGIRAYLGAPLLTADGQCLGTLAVMDLVPRCFTSKDADFLAITARWSLSEFERNYFLQQQPTNSTSWLPHSPEVVQYPQSGQPNLTTGKLLLANSKNPPPRPPSLQANGGVGSPLLLGEGCDSSPIHQEPPGNQKVSNTLSAYLTPSHSIKVKLLSLLTQELRTPLTSVMGMASVLNRQVYGPLTTKQKEYLEIIHYSGQHLVSLVEEIVALGLLDETSEKLQLMSLDIEMLCQQAINSLCEIAKARQQKMRLSVEPGSHIWLLDKEKVRQMLYYLVFSVIHSAEAGGEIRIHASRKNDKLTIAIWVSHPWLGEGLPPVYGGITDLAVPSAASAANAADGFEALETSLLTSHLESSEPSCCAAYPPPTNQVLSSTELWTAFTLAQEPNNIPDHDDSRESLGLLLSCHLAELHGGQISLQGSSTLGYRYVVSLPQVEPAKDKVVL